MKTYKQAGVDIQAGDRLVEHITKRVRSTYGKRVQSGVGGFACLYRCGDRLLASGVDGVGTKIKLAQELNVHSTIGVDLVAMCINDILCTGAKPLFFMDYLAMGKLDPQISKQIIEGIVTGCRQAEAALIGGESAEMPDLYRTGEYDLAGFAVGEVYPDQVLDGARIESGDSLVGLPSSGFHANGYSWIRKLAPERELKENLLTPTLVYHKTLAPLFSKNLVRALAHITGGGWLNIARLNPKFDYIVEDQSHWENAPEIMHLIRRRTKASTRELYRTFNMGVGMVLVTPRPEQILKQTQAYLLGKVQTGTGQVVVNQTSL